MQDNYPFHNEVVVEIDGKAHKHWKSYDIDSDFLIAADAFKFDIGVPSSETEIPNFTGKEVKVKINDELVLTGIVDTTSHSFSKTNRTFSLNGRDKAAILVDCSAPITNVKGLSLLDAVKKIVSPLGINQVALKAKENPTLDKIDIDIGETAWNAVMRCANSAGLHAWFEPNGVLTIGGADYSVAPVASLLCFKTNGVEHNNFSQANLTFDVSQAFSEVTFLAQRHGRSGDDNKNDLKWVYKNPDIKTYKPKTVVVPDVEDLAALQKWAKKYLSDAKLETFNLTITVPDHKTQEGELWMPGQRVYIYCEEYGIDDIFFLMGRRFTLSRSGGTQTELRFKQDGVWTPDAYKPKRESKQAQGQQKKQTQGKLLVSDGKGGWE